MDDLKRSTLDLIEQLSELLSKEEAGYQLILVANDYLLDDDLPNTIRVLRKVPNSYLHSNQIVIHMNISKNFKTAIANLIDIFGDDLSLYTKEIKG